MDMEMAALDGEGLWCGASLRPWQILHSRLARLHTCALLEREVRELMNETMEAAVLHRYHPLSYLAFNHLMEDKEEELQILEGHDDGELWRHGGLMEARIRDWLTSRNQENERKEAPFILHLNYDHDHCTSATFSNEFRATPAEELYVASDVTYGFSEGVDMEDGENYGYGDHAYTVSTCKNHSSESWNGIYLEQAMHEAVTDALAGSRLGVNEEEEENHSANLYASDATNSVAQLHTEAHSCQFSRGYLQIIDAEDEQLCAVCLEKLCIREEDDQQLQVLGISDITSLPCRHCFHTSCLSPWLSTSALCPCCRAPITLSCPLHVEAPPNLGVAGASCSDRVQREMMRLVADVEAALGRFGLLS